MFAVELHFDDGISADELIVVRRNAFVIGASDEADVMIEGAANPGHSVQIRRKLGRSFSSQLIGVPAKEENFIGSGEVELGNVVLRVIPLDLDLLLGAGESMDRGGIRVLRRALSKVAPEFPALSVGGNTPFVISFSPDQPVLVGRSRSCAVRVDGQNVAPEHLRVGSIRAISGEPDYWLEPATAGVSVVVDGEHSITARTPFQPGSEAQLGENGPTVRLITATGGSAARKAVVEAPAPPPPNIAVERYPCLVSRSDLMRPERYPLLPGRRVSIGRDPANDIWLNASHISRLHAELVVGDDESIILIDHSSNGTFIEGERLQRELDRPLPKGLSVLDFARGMTVGLCYSPKEEQTYLGKDARPRRSSSLHGQILSQIIIPTQPFNSDEDQEQVPPAWFAQQSSEASPPPPASDSWGSQGFRKPLVKTAFETPVAYAPVEEPVLPLRPERVEEFAPAKRLGLSGKLAFWGLFVFLVIMNYYVYFYLEK